MSQWDIWSEGYNDMGNIGRAQKMNEDPIEAESFDDAVRQHVAAQSTTRPYLGGPSPASYYHRHDDGSWSMWACRLYPDEGSARKFMG
ncbi:hypothetical protein [Pseudarthrobacter sp. PS3-L1]|uniref:hypothetical protein n=1 Tax=Pseudarthrobacter sp. PS3-L1 TaxID=3046207 RepID=UPI0024BA4DC6|nr:hypothetical protein [Pseudarthrobacter sp. PS3-L1]MDJ0321641.1 hypothetical protein [Pseudarthrobacter sp. PS3-L1]